MKLSLLIGSALLAASTFIYAQTPPADAGKGDAPKHRRFDCSKAKDPKACEERAAKMKERRAKMQEMHSKAAKACEGQQGDAQKSCMRKEMCAQAKDPAQCEARAKAGAERRAKAREACKDKPEADRRACMREQFRKK